MDNKTVVMKFLLWTITIFLLFPSTTNALPYKNTPTNKSNADETGGYTLFAPEDTTTTYLIDYNKEVVHIWGSSYLPGHSVYLLENGNLLRTAFIGANPVFLSGGMGGGVQEFDWNGTIVWDFRYSSNTYLSHHDIQYLSNGNVLLIAWEAKSFEEAVSAGRNPTLVTIFGIWPDHIIEVKPTGPASGDIVWEWHVWDHLIQDYDPSKLNYGVVEDHPELIDINFGRVTMDWNHINSIDYNEEFDQILLSVHNFNEIWVIDHSTTTEEATGHSGGNSGKGGDLLYRWGNPRAYRAGTTSDRKFYGQHDARWIQPGCPGDGNILVFNNGLGRPGSQYSSIDEIVLPVDSNGSYYLQSGSAYGPDEQIWIYTAENPPDFYAYMISGAQRIENGNTVICDGKQGRFFEVTYDKETIWEYVNPYPSQSLNDVFKIERYPSNYPGLAHLIQQPENPERPIGTVDGEIRIDYIYSSSTTDPQDDQIYFMFDWGDNSNSGWIGPYSSGETANASHSWTRKGNFNIKVKAKDIYGHLSEWSEPLSVTMPRESIIKKPVLQFLEHHAFLYKIYNFLFRCIEFEQT
jgi:hypothetical protein